MANKLKTCILVTVLLRAHVALAKEESDEEKTQACVYLNGVRANFTACCEYPSIVIWEWEMNICEKQCGSNPENEDEDDVWCCVLVCAFNSLNVLNSSTEVAPMLPSGFIYSFMISAGYDTLWEPVITDAVHRCFPKFSETDMGIVCDVIPKSMYAIIDCAYRESYIKCPIWNPDGRRECAYTAEYARKCVGPTYEDQ